MARSRCATANSLLEWIVWGTEWKVAIDLDDLDSYREQVAMDAAGEGCNGVPVVVRAASLWQAHKNAMLQVFDD